MGHPRWWEHTGPPLPVCPMPAKCPRPSLRDSPFLSTWAGSWERLLSDSSTLCLSISLGVWVQGIVLSFLGVQSGCQGPCP